MTWPLPQHGFVSFACTQGKKEKKNKMNDFLHVHITFLAITDLLIYI